MLLLVDGTGYHLLNRVYIYLTVTGVVDDVGVVSCCVCSSDSDSDIGTEHGEALREFWKSLLMAFLWGAVVAALVSYLLESLIATFVVDLFVLAVVIAPVIEEGIKPVGLWFTRKKIDELEDGLIYGAVIGLGFAATENLVYGVRFWDQGFLVLLSLFYIRTVGSSLLHATATGLTGYGFAHKQVIRQRWFPLVPYLLLAMVVHSMFNVFAFSVQTVHQIIGVVVAVIFAVVVFYWIRKKIQLLDQRVLTKGDVPLVKKSIKITRTPK
jgi:RsiW-degrading membrane proteinase PrsW (M82 family)